MKWILLAAGLLLLPACNDPDTQPIDWDWDWPDTGVEDVCTQVEALCPETFICEKSDERGCYECECRDVH